MAPGGPGESRGIPMLRPNPASLMRRTLAGLRMVRDSAESPDDGAGRRPAGTDLIALRDQLRKFAAERNWEQFHTPRNLLLALVGEVGELAELFQWVSDEQAAVIMRDEQLAARVREELADVLGYVVQLADALGIDLYEALRAKIILNGEKYPASLAHGTAAKYTELRDQGSAPSEAPDGEEPEHHEDRRRPGQRQPDVVAGAVPEQHLPAGPRGEAAHRGRRTPGKGILDS